jgi:thiamine biosynthesis lipoprotein
MSTYKPDSEISLLNRAAGAHAVPVSPATMGVLQASLLYGNLSRGRFDVTVGPLVRLWGFTRSTNPDQLPTPEQIQAARELVGYTHLVLSNDTAFLDRPGMAVDLGGIAKGYAVDVCYRRLLEMGARNFMINLGGNIRCAGTPGRRSAWKIGVRNPFADATENGAPIIGTLQLTNGMAVSTSGNYERFVTIQGKRYAHIIDPVSGLPASGIAGVTVLTTNATHSDGIDTGLFLLGLDGSRPVLAAMPETEAIFIPDTPETPAVWLTPGLQPLFTPADDWAGKVHKLELPAAGSRPSPDQP